MTMTKPWLTTPAILAGVDIGAASAASLPATLGSLGALGIDAILARGAYAGKGGPVASLPATLSPRVGPLVAEASKARFRLAVEVPDLDWTDPTATGPLLAADFVAAMALAEQAGFAGAVVDLPHNLHTEIPPIVAGMRNAAPDFMLVDASRDRLNVPQRTDVVNGIRDFSVTGNPSMLQNALRTLRVGSLIRLDAARDLNLLGQLGQLSLGLALSMPGLPGIDGLVAHDGSVVLSPALTVWCQTLATARRAHPTLAVGQLELLPTPHGAIAYRVFDDAGAYVVVAASAFGLQLPIDDKPIEVVAASHGRIHDRSQVRDLDDYDVEILQYR